MPQGTGQKEGGDKGGSEGEAGELVFFLLLPWALEPPSADASLFFFASTILWIWGLTRSLGGISSEAAQS